MQFREILTRLTGISTPVFGVTWTAPEAERAVARRVINFLEDRRVLYVPSEMELPRHCVESVLTIRTFLAHELEQSRSKNLTETLKAMQAACRKFLNTVTERDPEIVRFGDHHNHWASWVFNGALGEMRGVFGIHKIGRAHV